ncbi:hypothetical protein ACIBW9_35555 [Streptomyces sp. NPDC049541]|uniref:hypothetical protein n=1 Tax=Streptomyces sp. NPDC049541 TaxID=3365594 RepID=UPI0037881E11
MWDSLNFHLQQELFDVAEERKDWLVVFHPPSHAPEFNPQVGIRSLLKCDLTDFAAAGLADLGPGHSPEAEDDPVLSRRARRLPAAIAISA